MVDVILRLIDSNALKRLHSMSIEQLVLAFESGRLGDERPAGDPRFHRSFSVDIEGDFLEWADKSNGQLDAAASLILCDWSSVAECPCAKESGASLERLRAGPIEDVQAGGTHWVAKLAREQEAVGVTAS